MNESHDMTDRDKLLGLFRFAQGLLAAKQGVLMRMQDTQLGYFPEMDIRDLPGIQVEPDDESWLRLERLRETQPPAVEPILSEWVDGRFDDPGKNPQFKSVIVREAEIEEVSELCEAGLLSMDDVHAIVDEADQENEDKVKIVLRLDRLDDLRSASEAWSAGPWEDWAREERPVRKSIGLYNRLFQLHNMMHGGVAATPPELVWGIGISRWQLGDRQIDMPLIEQLVDLEVQKGGVLCIRPRDVAPIVSLKPFLDADVSGSSDAQRYLQDRFRKISSSDDMAITPFDTTAWENLLDAAATRLSARARHITRENIREGAEIRSPSADLAIYSSWTIYGRPRSENLREQDLEMIRSKIDGAESDEALPKSLRGFVAPKTEDKLDADDDWGLGRTNFGNRAESIGEGTGSDGVQASDQAVANGAGHKTSGKPKDEKVYFFPLAYNEEQSKIIDRLEVEDVVTVTGPPGTGKTHSIANIISHFMATGRRVLVTARTAEAIAAVREKLPGDLASLVIASVASDREGAKQLEEAVQKLADDVVSLDVDNTREEVARLEADIVQADRDMRECDRKLSDIAGANLAPLTWNGVERTAMEMTDILTELAPTHDWMTDRPAGVPPARLDAIVERLRQGLPKVAGDVVYIGGKLPDPSELPTAADLLDAHKVELEYRNRPVEDFSEQPVMARDTADAEDVAAASYAAIDAARKTLEPIPDWERDLAATALRVRLTGKTMPAVFAVVEHSLRLLQDYDPGEIVYDAKADVRLQVIEAVDRARTGSRPLPLGASIFNRGLLAAFESIRLDGRAPEASVDWQRVYDALMLEDLRLEFEDLWNDGASAGLLPQLPDTTVEMTAMVRHAATRVAGLAEAVELVLPALESLNQLFPYGLDVDASLDALDFEPLLKALRANRKDPYVPPRALEQLESIADRDTRPIYKYIGVLRDAIGRDSVGEPDIIKARSAITTEFLRLDDLGETLSRIEDDLVAMREAGVPDWAAACLANPENAERILRHDWREAWDWAVMNGRVRRIIDLGNGDEWREKKSAHRKRRERQFEQLIRARTLLGLKRRLTGPVQTALMSFTNAIRRLGRGTGKSAVRWRKAVRAAAMQAAPAAPVWIMPEYKIAEQLPAELEDFDLIILDEASQSDITAIAALARGKKNLIVGDEKQVSPSAVGVPQNKIDVLRAEHLASLPNKNVIDENTSIFEIAMQMYPSTHLMLREHFRCAEPIIQFSMRFYNGRLIPLRVPKASDRFDPPLVDVFVKGGERQGKTNEAEAQFIVDEIAAIASDPLHTHRDIAVISLIGREQAELIERMLMEDRRIGTDGMERMGIVCGDSRTMQGQERSIVFLSMVAVPESSRVQRSQSDAQRFNVALSRARDRLYLVRSVSTHDLKSGDLKLEVLEHFADPMPEGRAVTGQGVLELCESGFERDVCTRLLDANYRVRSQVKVGPYSIDLVVEGADDRRLAIELDGDFWHGPEKWEQDMMRQSALERAGWTFWRVFGSQWMTEKDYWWRHLTQTMTAMGISPIGAGASEDVFTEFRLHDAIIGRDDSEAEQGHVEAEEGRGTVDERWTGMSTANTEYPRVGPDQPPG